jgi:hypothetical protein
MEATQYNGSEAQRELINTHAKHNGVLGSSWEAKGTTSHSRHALQWQHPTPDRRTRTCNQKRKKAMILGTIVMREILDARVFQTCERRGEHPPLCAFSKHANRHTGMINYRKSAIHDFMCTLNQTREEHNLICLNTGFSLDTIRIFA